MIVVLLVLVGFALGLVLDPIGRLSPAGGADAGSIKRAASAGMLAGFAATGALAWFAVRRVRVLMTLEHAPRDGSVTRAAADRESAPTRSHASDVHDADLVRSRSAALGRELHDVAGQHLTGATLMLAAAERKSLRPAVVGDERDAVDPSDGQVAGLVTNALEQVETALDVVRHVSRRLEAISERPADVEDAEELIAAGAGLGAVLHAVAAQANHSFGGDIEVSAVVSEALSSQGGAGVASVAGIAREAMTNAVRHGRASRVRVVLRHAETGGVASCVLEVVDDGCGISEKTARGDADAGLGVRTMRARADRLGGRLELGSWTGHRGGLESETGGYVKLVWPRTESEQFAAGTVGSRAILSGGGSETTPRAGHP